MSASREIRCYEYVNRPYEAVKGLLERDPAALLQRATHAASERASSLSTQLHVKVAGLEIGKDVDVHVVKVDSTGHAPASLTQPATTIELTWRASTADALFPAMRAELVAHPLSAGETQLELRGHYTPPGSVLGTAADALLGHRIAEASIHRLLEDLVARLSADAPAS